METSYPVGVLPPWVPRSICGAVLAGLYVILAVLIVISDRKSGGGGWISLSGMVSYLATFPVSVLGEMLGIKLDFRRNFDMGFAILICALGIYLVGAGFGWVARQLFSSGTRG